MSNSMNIPLKWVRLYEPRRLIDDNEPDGYQESDNDYMINNKELVIEILDHLDKVDIGD